VSLLTRLESDLRDSLARVFIRGSVTVVDLGRALVAEDSRSGAPDGPRVFDVWLSPGDLDGLRAHAGSVPERLGELVAGRRRERGAPEGHVDIRFVPDGTLAPGAFRVQASAEGAPSAGTAAGGTAVGSHVFAGRGTGSGEPAPASLPGRPRLVVVLGGTVVNGTDLAAGDEVELELDEHVALIGSAPDSNLLLPAGMVAPQHLEVRYRSDGYHEAVALNGAPLRVNGVAGEKGLLTDGARLELGEVALVYRRELDRREAAGAAREGFTRTDGA